MAGEVSEPMVYRLTPAMRARALERIGELETDAGHEDVIADAMRGHADRHQRMSDDYRRQAASMRDVLDRRAEGLHVEDGVWYAVVDGTVVFVGPDEAVARGAYRWWRDKPDPPAVPPRPPWLRDATEVILETEQARRGGGGN